MLGSMLTLFCEERPNKKPPGGILIAFRDEHFRRFLIVSALSGASMAFAWPLFPFVTIEIVGAAIWQIAVIGASWSLAAALGQRVFGFLADRIGRKPLLIASMTCLFLFPLLYALATNWLQLLAINVGVGFLISALSVVIPVYILDSAPEGQRGIYTASYNVVSGLTTFAGSLIGGAFGEYLLAFMDLRQMLFSALLLAAIMRLAAGLGFLTIWETLPKGSALASP
ncbi:TPA: MFS transporter [Candidatus Bathyarchaeota archaeon]|nr:MFS transporter [Candidatus Bathyarchaeota archaeon]